MAFVMVSDSVIPWVRVSSREEGKPVGTLEGGSEKGLGSMDVL